MTSRAQWSSASALCSIFLLLPPGLCHMEMNWPYALRSKFNPANSYEIIDYSMTSPLEGDGSNFPCKGYQNDQPRESVITYTAGSTYNISLSGTATHEGGSCQLSLSYDNGASFRVIKSMIGGCPLQSTYDFTIPSYMPAGNALLAWTWQNKVGNREFYMNCADVSIESGPSSRKQRREAVASFDALPYMWRANLADVNNCATIEGTDPVYPNPGPDVEYGDDMSSDSPPSSGDCDAPVANGPAYEATDETEASRSFPPFSYQPTDAADVQAQPTAPITSSEELAEASTTESVHDHLETRGVEPYYQPDFDMQARVLESTSQPSPAPPATSAYSTTTVYADCPDTITMTIYPSPSMTTTVTEVRSSSWTTRTTRPSPRSTSTVVHSRTYTVTPVRPTSTSPSQPTKRPPYAMGDLSSYLPCVPGTFICTSETTWQTCNWNEDGSEWKYGYPRDVSDGMMCLTNLAPYSGETNEYAQQALTPAGFFRDDRIVRERPDGDCDEDGSLMCTSGGTQFSICDHGGWVRMGRVAEGTTCENGRIVASS